ncbi:hypothetical protein LPB136_09900 [Tenacibaculum todarodis]|uniref:DUF11 domain-containing protein n=2 Tax=Tenacibaculum todarodis TaxID=1850252 RepID=A0A1L3JKP3_9FLAO|nr:hypothetical protein LPB136_09900 [Tenacibaculum todarodis]
MLVVFNTNAQLIPATNGRTNPCGDCVPNGWSDNGGTPDVSNKDVVAGTGGGLGAGQAWTNAPLTLPPNGHTTWITVRDVGTLTGEEAVGTTITGLTIGETYEVIIYSMSALAPTYSPKYIDYYQYQIQGFSEVNVTPVTREIWQTNRARFVATNTSRTFEFTPGNNMGNSTANLESVNISVSLNAINKAPNADDNSATTAINTTTVFNIVSTDSDSDGNIVNSTVDLNTSTPGIQNTNSTTEGNWSVDSSGNVTFIPNSNFLGAATLNYTVNDDYSLDGNSVPATSNPATLTVTVLPDNDGDGILDTVDEDDDNDGILDAIELGTCNTNNSTLNWDNEYIEGGNSFTSGQDPIATNPSLTINGTKIKLSRTTTGTLNTQEYRINDFYTTNPSYTLLQSSVTNSYSIHTFEFTEAIYNLGFTIYDLDKDINFTDNVQLVITKIDGTTHTLTVSEYILNGQTHTSPNTFTGTGSDTNANLIISGIKAWVSKIDVLFKNVDTTPSNNHGIGIGSFNFCNTPLDTDNDGTPDYKDLDSDNDGCSDALEAGTTTNQTTNYQFPSNDVSSTGVPNTAASSNNTGAFQDPNVKSCNCPFASGIDTDNDGIDDVCDLDDDNDGILDSNECTILSFQTGINPTPINGATTNNAQVGNVFFYSNAISDGNALNYDLRLEILSKNHAIEVTSDVTIKMPNHVANANEYVTYNVAVVEAGSVTNTTPNGIPVTLTNVTTGNYDIDASGGQNYSDIGGVSTNSGAEQNVSTVGNNVEFFTNPNYPTGFDTIRLKTFGTNNNDTFNENNALITNYNNFQNETYLFGINGPAASTERAAWFNLTGFICQDTDNDTIPDNLDTDSDNDGCPDAVEANGSFIVSQLTTLTGGSNGVDSSLLNFGITVNNTEGSANYGVPIADANGLDISTDTPQDTTPAGLDKDDTSACVTDVDLSLTKTVNKAIVKVGDTIVYTLTVKNDGPSDATGVQVTDVLPSGVTYNSTGTGTVIPSGTTYNDALTPNIWNIGNVAVNQTIILQLEVTVNGAGTITNTSEITHGDQPDTDSVPNNSK